MTRVSAGADHRGRRLLCKAMYARVAGDIRNHALADVPSELYRSQAEPAVFRTACRWLRH